MLDGIGATEMQHIFLTNRFDDHHPGCTGRPVRGYEARIVDAQMREVRVGTIGQLAVRVLMGCRYLADGRQKACVRAGWNLTDDRFWQEAGGRFHFAARPDDMIISAGYNIAGPEVEAALMAHPAVVECAVVGAPDAEWGMIVEALVRALQDHVKAQIPPYKYPRRVVFAAALPKMQTGKIQRFQLRKA